MAIEEHSMNPAAETPFDHVGVLRPDSGEDQLLYHYTRAETAIEKILPQRTL